MGQIECLTILSTAVWLVREMTLWRNIGHKEFCFESIFRAHKRFNL